MTDELPVDFIARLRELAGREAAELGQVSTSSTCFWPSRGMSSDVSMRCAPSVLVVASCAISSRSSAVSTKR
jgi:hypothetical protein